MLHCAPGVMPRLRGPTVGPSVVLRAPGEQAPPVAHGHRGVDEVRAGSAPSRSTRTGVTVASTTVGGSPSRRPPSTTHATSAAANACATSCASVSRSGTVRHGPCSRQSLRSAATIGHPHGDGPGPRVRLHVVGPTSVRAWQEDLDRSRPAPLEQPAQLVVPGRGRGRGRRRGGPPRSGGPRGRPRGRPGAPPARATPSARPGSSPPTAGTAMMAPAVERTHHLRRAAHDDGRLRE